MLEERLVQQALTNSGLLDRDSLPEGGTRGLRRNGLILVQPGVVAAVTQPLDAAALVQAAALSLTAPYAFLGRTALWLHGAGPAPAIVEVGVPSSRGIRVFPPVVGRRVAPSLLTAAVQRAERPVVGLEVAVVQAADDLTEPKVLELVEEVLRARRTTHARLLAVCRRGVAGSAAVRRALVELDDADLDRQQRRLRRALQDASVRGLESEVHFVSSRGASCSVDLLHRSSRRAFETDGARVHGTRAQQLVDRRRDRWMLLDHGISTTRFAVSEVRDRLPELVGEALQLIARAQ